MASSDTNVAVVSGRLTNDPVSKKVGESENVSFRLASNKRIGKDKERPLFIDVSIWREGLAGIVKQYKKKGDSVIVTGYIRQDQWEKDGKKESKIYIEADDVVFCGGPKFDDADTTAKVASTTVAPSKTAPPKKATPVAQEQEEDTPF